MNRSKQKRKATESADKKRKTTRTFRGPAPPPSIDLNITHSYLNNFDATTISRILLQDNNTDQVANALNALLRTSADDSANYCLGPGGEKIISALVTLFDEAIGWNDDNDDSVEKEADAKLNCNPEPTVATWDPSSLLGKHKRWRKLCREKLASPLASSVNPQLLITEPETKILDEIIAILRNLSFVAQNTRFILYSEGALRILTGALYYRGYSSGGSSGGSSSDDRAEESSSTSSSHSSNMCIHAIQTLTNIAPLIDVTGRQLFIDRAFLESDAKEVLYTVPGQQIPPDNEELGEGEDGETRESSASAVSQEKKNGHPMYGLSTYLGFGGMYLSKQYDTKAETLDNIPNSVVWDVAGTHVRAILAIFPALSAILDPNDITAMHTSCCGWHRPSIQAVLELLNALVENPDSKGVFLCISDKMLHCLTDMLYIPRLGPESMDYVDPVSNTVTRITALKLRMGYDASIDSLLRDMSCDVLVKLTDLSTGLKKRLGCASSMSTMARRQNAQTNSSSELAPSILHLDESSSSRRMNVRLYDSLLPMISSVSGRGDAGSLAVRLISNLAQVPENKAGVRYVERKLMSKASTDAHIGKLAFNGIFNKVN